MTDETPTRIDKYTILSTSQLCKRLNRDRRFVYWLIKKGHLVAWRNGNRFETSEANLQQYIDSLQKGTK